MRASWRHTRGLVLTPEALVRSDVPLEVTGADAVRAFIGLDAGGLVSEKLLLTGQPSGLLAVVTCHGGAR